MEARHGPPALGAHLASARAPEIGLSPLDGQAKALEEREDFEITAQALAALRQMFGRVPQPKRVIVTRWGDDPFSYGSYSFVGVGATGADYSTIAEPVGHRARPLPPCLPYH